MLFWASLPLWWRLYGLSARSAPFTQHIKSVAREGTLIAASFVLILLVIILVSARTFLVVMYDDQMTYESVIEAGNYAVQTVTTVGYGDWATPAIPKATPDPTRPYRVLRMKGWSIVFMLLGATFYTLAVGAVVAILLPSLTIPQRGNAG
jgi:hypothetical protein